MPETVDGEMTVQKLLDLEAIRQVLYRYARAIDRADFELLETVFWPDATEDHGRGEAGTIQDFVEWSRKIAESDQIDRQTHRISNVTAVFDTSGTSAAVESYILSLHLWRKDGREYDEILSGRFLDHMVKRNGEWRILSRKMVRDFMHRLPGAESWEDATGISTIRHGRRKPQDILYTFLDAHSG